MRDEPADLPPDLVRDLVRRHWGLGAETVTYAPVGGGSYHWHARGGGGRWFVTADRLDLAQGQRTLPWLGTLRRCYETAASLRAGGLEFVVAPVPDREGQLVRAVSPKWALAVMPFVDGDPAGSGHWTDSGQRCAVARLVGRLHLQPPPAGLVRWELEVPQRAELTRLRSELDRPWVAGPYGERARRLLARSLAGVDAMFARFDTLAERVRAANEPWVVTHGEPHSGNVLRGRDGGYRLIDWDTVRLAPRERDLATVAGDDAAALAAYREVAGPVACSPEAVDLYRLWWDLSEICAFAVDLAREHDETPDARKAWANLRHYLPVERRWPALG